MLWNAIRVGADLYAASMVAGATVLMPYLLLMASIAAHELCTALLVFESRQIS